MWFLPPGPWNISLPEGLLWLPHHYTATDREALLDLLRAVMPDCPQLLVDATSLDGLLERRVTWPDGLALVHGFTESTDDDGLRARVARLGARHALVQLGAPQLTGTSWLEPVLKVPLLRSLERAWRAPAHSLRDAGIGAMPLRDVARFTDDPVEFLSIVKTTVEHRLRSVAVGVTPNDWARSLDHALASRLESRATWPLPVSSLSLIERDAVVETVDAAGLLRLREKGLAFDAPGGLRTAPLLNALTRPLVRAYALPSLKREGDELGERARELFHMASEAAVLRISVDPRVFGRPSGVLRELLGDRDGWPRLIRKRPRPLDALRLKPDSDEDLSSKLLQLHGAAQLGTPAKRKTARALTLYLSGLLAVGANARAELTSAIQALEQIRMTSGWLVRAMAALRHLLLLWTWITRRDVGELDESMGALLGVIPARDNLREVVACLRHARDVDQVDNPDLQNLINISRGQPFRIAADDLDGVWALGWSNLWAHQASGNAAVIASNAWRYGTGSEGVEQPTVGHLHNDLVVGIAALSIGDLDLAVERGRLVLGLAIRYEIPIHRAFARELLAAVHEFRGEYDEAAKLLFQARSRYRALQDSPRIVGVERRLARMGISFDAIELARSPSTE